MQNKSLLSIALISLSVLSGCSSNGGAEKEAAIKSNLMVSEGRKPLETQPMIEMFVFTDSKGKMTAPPKKRTGYKIRISLDE